jgi:hypothetical protein
VAEPDLSFLTSSNLERILAPAKAAPAADAVVDIAAARSARGAAARPAGDAPVRVAAGRSAAPVPPAAEPEVVVDAGLAAFDLGEFSFEDIEGAAPGGPGAR